MQIVDIGEHLAPETIERRSFEIIDSLVPEPRRYSGHLWEVARRMIHTAGDPSLLMDIELSSEGVRSGCSALRSGCTIYTDTEMAACGIPRRRMDALGCSVQPVMRLPGIAEMARQENTTRARTGIRMIRDAFAGSILVIGNAPTALLAVLELISQGADVPALIIGMPVGFVHAEESKALLHETDCPHFTILGRRGGSALAASCVNALAEICLREKNVP